MNPASAPAPVADQQPTPQANRADIHGELVHRLSLLERACREAREGLCLHTHIARSAAQQGGVIVPTGNVKQTPAGAQAEFADQRAAIREAAKETLGQGALQLRDVVQLSQHVSEVAIAVLKSLGMVKT